MAIIRILGGSIDSKHPDYLDYEEDWNDIDNLCRGEKAMKDAGVVYVPRLKGQTPTEYADYIERGSFYGATRRTIVGFTGSIMRKVPFFELPDSMEPMKQRATREGLQLKEVAQNVTDKLLRYGRHGILSDYDDVENQGILSEYIAKNIYNWEVKNVNGKKMLTYLTLAETYWGTNDITQNFEEIPRIRQLSIENGYMVQRLWEKREIEIKGKLTKSEWVQIEVKPGVKDHYPVVNGQKWKEIPFVFFGAVKNTPDIEPPPLWDLACLNISHWRLSVDYEHGLHFCALPTIYLLGFKKNQKIAVGPGRVIRNPDPESKVGILEFTGQGLNAVVAALESKERKMAVLGSRLLEEQKRSAEAAETLQIRTSGETATLFTIANNVESGMLKVLKYEAMWSKEKEDSIIVEINKDFINKQIDAKVITALLNALQAGKISQETWLYNLKDGEMLPEDITIEDEIERIEKNKKENEQEVDEREDMSFEQNQQGGGQNGNPFTQQNQDQDSES